jgi:glycosyltransferase involved in cell wall biosynthesis
MAEIAAGLVSIIVPCYNQGRFLAGALNSVLEQQYTCWECLVINDGSTDNTEAVAIGFCKKDARFRYINQPNGGLSAARNIGIRLASGAYIQLLDADDLLEKGKLLAAMDFYVSAAEGRTIVYSSMRYFEHNAPSELKILGRNDFIAHIETHLDDGLNEQRQLLVARNPFVVSASLYPKMLFDAVGCFDEELKALEDWDFHLRCNQAGFTFHHLYFKGARTLIRLHDDSMMRNQGLLDRSFYHLILKHKIRALPVGSRDTLLQKVVRNMLPPVFLRLLKKTAKKS